MKRAAGCCLGLKFLHHLACCLNKMSDAEENPKGPRCATVKWDEDYVNGGTLVDGKGALGGTGIARKYSSYLALDGAIVTVRLAFTCFCWRYLKSVLPDYYSLDRPVSGWPLVVFSFVL